MNRGILHALAGLACGVLFGIGLAVAGMTNPEKVLAFLNVTGRWDPSLAFTMAGAIAVTALGYRLILHRGPILSGTLHLPTRRDVDTRLVAGSVVFGAGWGLAGYCPGPALTGLAGGSAEPLVFVAAMIAGGQIARFLEERPRPTTT